MSNEYISFIDLNLNEEGLQAWDGKNRILPPGRYLFQVDDVKQGTTATSGKPRLEVKLSVVEGEYKDWKITGFYMIDPNNTGSRSRMLSLTTATKVLRPDGKFDASEMKGKKLYASVEHGSYNAVDTRTGEKVLKQNQNVVGEEPYDETPTIGNMPLVGTTK